MNLIEEVRTVLGSGGFHTMLGPSTPNTVYFEDTNLVGAVFIHADLPSLLASWETFQDRFLGNNSRALRSDPIKAWNVYTVHLTSDKGGAAQRTEAFNIEQDFRGTRKLVRTGVSKRVDVREALLPLLPLQHRTALTATNVADRLRERLALSSKVLVKITDHADPSVLEPEILEEP